MHSTEALVCILVLAALVFTVGPGVRSLYAGPVDETIQELEKMQDQGKEPAFQVKLTVEGGKSTFKPGDTISFAFETDKDCHLYLIDQGTSLTNTLIFPNKWETNSKVSAGSDHTFPPSGSNFHFQISSNSQEGLEVVLAVASDKPIQKLEDLLRADAAENKGRRRPVVRIKNPRRVMKDVVAELRDTSGKWGWQRATFSIQKSE